MDEKRFHVHGRMREPAQLPLHRKLLFPTLNIGDSLPQIVVGDNDGLVFLNERLYHLIALILRAYVLSWYTRFTKDRTLLPIMAQDILLPILSPILTNVYLNPDTLLRFILLDLPMILRLHLDTYWSAYSASYLFPANQTSLGSLYHSRLPLSSVQQIEEPMISLETEVGTPYRRPNEVGEYILSPTHLTLISNKLLYLHLPKSETSSKLEISIAKDILGRSVLGSIGRKLSEGWFWYLLFLKFLEPKTNSKALDDPNQVSHQPVPILEKVINLLVTLWSVLSLLWSTGSSLIATYSIAPPLDPEYVGSTMRYVELGRAVLGVDGRHGITRRTWSLRLISGLIEGIVTLLSPVLDRLIPHLIRSEMTISTSLKLIELIEKILFPLDGYPAPAPPDLTTEETLIAKKQLEMRLQQRIPTVVRSVMFPQEDSVQMLINPIDDPSCNAHLVGMLLDSIIVTLEPGLSADKMDKPQGLADADDKVSIAPNIDSSS